MGFWEKCDRQCTWCKICCWVWTIAICAGVLAVLVAALAVLFPPVVNSEDAVLQRFDLTAGTPPANSTVSYNATVVLAFRNRNFYRGIRYGPLFAASLFFNGSRFHESTTALESREDGQAVSIVPSASTLPACWSSRRRTRREGFGVELRLETVMRYKGLKRVRRLVVICPLKLQLVRRPGVAPAPAPAAKNGTNCNSGENSGEHDFCRPTRRCYILKEDD